MVILVSHLTTPDGKSHEHGGMVELRHFKGSRAIGFWTAVAIGLERDKYHEDPDARRTTTVRLIKCRRASRFEGETFDLDFNHNTGRLFEKEPGFIDQETGEEVY